MITLLISRGLAAGVVVGLSAANDSSLNYVGWGHL